MTVYQPVSSGEISPWLALLPTTHFSLSGRSVFGSDVAPIRWKWTVGFDSVSRCLCVDGGLSSGVIRMVGGSFVLVCVRRWPIDVSQFEKWMTMRKRRWLVVSSLVHDRWWRALIGFGFWLCSGVTPIMSLDLTYVLVKMWWFCDACFFVGEDFNTCPFHANTLTRGSSGASLVTGCSLMGLRSK